MDQLLDEQNLKEGWCSLPWRGLGTGTRSSLSQTPAAASVLNLNSLKVPRLHCASFWRASPFIAGVLGPLWQMLRTKALYSWMLGVARGLEPLFFWVLGSSLVLFLKWDRGQAGNGGSTGQRTQGWG